MTDPENGDRDRLTALFRDAAGDPPPSGFDHERVVAASRRITRRRRSAVLSGAAALLVVLGAGAVAALPRGGNEAGSTAAAPAMAPEAGPSDAAAPFDAAPFDGPGDAAPGDTAPGDGAGPGDAPEAVPAEPFRADAPEAAPFSGAPLGPGTAACADGQDPELRALLEQVLPEVIGAPATAVTTQCRPPGERGVSLEVDDAGTPGLFRVLYVPPGAGPVTDDPGYTARSTSTASGGTVVVGVSPGGPTGALPFSDRLGPVVDFLAPRL